MYFPNAFKKVYVASTTAGDIDLRTTGTTADLDPGEIGLFDAKTYAAIAAAPGSGNQPFILAQGSYFSSDKIGKYHGGYQESIKSKIINPKYVSRFFKVTAQTPLSQILLFGWDGTATGEGLTFRCGETYHLRADIKGSAALRTLTHNAYHTFDYFTGCCLDNCSISCTGDPVDAAVVMQGFANQINEDPIVSEFIRATPVVRTTTQAGTASSGSTAVTLSGVNANIAVGQRVFGTGIAPLTTVSAIAGTALTLSTASVAAVSGTLAFGTVVTDAYTEVEFDGDNAAAVEAVVAGIIIEVAYSDTVFGNCTFTVTDSYDLEPLFVYLSITDETGDPCTLWPRANSSTPEAVVELQEPRQASGTGESVLRDLILFQRYLQNPFPDGNNVDQLRLREVLNDPSMDTVTRSALYDQICILHTVPRGYNPTGVFDNDQYLLVVNVPTGTDADDFIDLVQDMLDLAGNGITLENF